MEDQWAEKVLKQLNEDLTDKKFYFVQLIYGK